MTYEKFEHKAIQMLLEGDDPRLKKLMEQIAVSEVLLRTENNLGFEVEIAPPPILAIADSEGTITGVEVQLSEFPIVNLELNIRNGLINRFKAIYATEMTYAELIEHYDELVFAYTDKKSSILNFQADNRDPNEVTLVKNIASISEQIDANIMKINYEQPEPAVKIVDEIFPNSFKPDSTPISSIRIDDEAQKSRISDEKSNLATTSQPLIVESDELEKIIARLNEQTLSEQDPSQELSESTLKKWDEPEFEEVVAEIVKDAHPVQTPIDNLQDEEEDSIIQTTDESDPIIEAVLKNYQEKPTQESPQVYDDIMLPPSFSIPKIPDAIKERWSVDKEATPVSTHQSVDLSREVFSQIAAQQSYNSDRVAVRDTNVSREYDPYIQNDHRAQAQTLGNYYESNVGLTDLLDGKSPQGGVSSTEQPQSRLEENRFERSETFGNIHSFDHPSPIPNGSFESADFKNHVSKEMNPNFKLENTGSYSTEVLENIALSETDEAQMNLEIERMEMEQRGREVKLAVLFIALGIIFLLVWLIIAFF